MDTVAFDKITLVLKQYNLYKNLVSAKEEWKQQYENNKSADLVFLRDKIAECENKLSKYNKRDIEVVKAVLSINEKIMQCTSDIRRLEEKSQIISDNKVLVLDDAGQKHYISVSLENEYSMRVKEKRSLLSQFSAAVKTVLGINVVVEGNSADNLEDELNIVNEKIKKLIETATSGKKEMLVIEGKQMMFPIASYGIYQNLKRRQIELLKQLGKSTDETVDRAEIIDSFSQGEVIIKKSDGIKKLSEKMYSKAKYVVYYAAVALFAGTVLMSNLLPKSSNLIDNKVSAYHSTQQQEQIVIDDVISEEDIDTIVLKENARIYKDSYSADKKQNSYKPYYNGQTKHVAGVTFVKDGKLITIYRNDPEFDKKYHTLLEQNASIRSYLTDVNGDYEGYYNVQDVKGKHR